MEIKPAHIARLVEIESRISYNELPDDGKSFIVQSRPSSVMLSAPHGARTFRNTRRQRWHEEDEYTAGIALLLGGLCETSVIATIACNQQYDPNYHRDCDYKQRLADVIRGHQIRFVLDLHGAALHSTTLDSNQTIDLGYRSDNEDKRSMDEIHIQTFENILNENGTLCDSDCFVVGRNHFRAAGGKISEPITTFVHRLNVEHDVQGLQIEMKPQLRVVKRFPTASLYKSCGDYSAETDCVIQMLQSLIDFIDYLESSIENEE